MLCVVSVCSLESIILNFFLCSRVKVMSALYWSHLKHARIFGKLVLNIILFLNYTNHQNHRRRLSLKEAVDLLTGKKENQSSLDVYIYIYVHACVCGVCVRACVHTCTCVYVRACMCMCVCICLFCMYVGVVTSCV